MNTDHEDLVKRLAMELPPETRLQLSLTRHARSEEFKTFGDQLKAVAPGIDIQTEVTTDTEPPWVATAGGIRFQALPEDDKLDGFIDALKPLDGADAGLRPVSHE